MGERLFRSGRAPREMPLDALGDLSELPDHDLKVRVSTMLEVNKRYHVRETR